MPDKEEKEFPLEIHGMSNLKDGGAPENQSEEEKAQAEAEKRKLEEGEAAERTKQFLATKHTVKVAGQDVTLTGEEFVNHFQKNAGLEVTNEKRVQELARAIEETKNQVVEMASRATPTAPTKEDELDPDSPEGLIDGRVKTALTAAIGPIQEQLTKLTSVFVKQAERLSPQLTIGDRTQAKEILKANGVEQFDDFDTYHDKMVSFVERRKGREPNSSQEWAQAYLIVRDRGAIPSSELKPKEEEKTLLEEKKENKEKLIGTGLSATKISQQQSTGDKLRAAKETKNWGDFDFHEEIMKRNRNQQGSKGE